jgi:hypothetical protein
LIEEWVGKRSKEEIRKLGKKNGTSGIKKIE